MHYTYTDCGVGILTATTLKQIHHCLIMAITLVYACPVFVLVIN